MLSALFQTFKNLPRRAPQSVVPGLQCICISLQTDTLIEVIESSVHQLKTESTAESTIGCSLTVVIISVSLYHLSYTREYVFTQTAFIVVKSLASNKMSVKTEGCFPQSIHIPSLSDTLSLLSSRYSIRSLIMHELILQSQHTSVKLVPHLRRESPENFTDYSCFLSKEGSQASRIFKNNSAVNNF